MSEKANELTVVPRPRVSEIEKSGIETIPEDKRSGKPIDMFGMTFGGANSFSTMVLGAFPVLVFGLSFQHALLAMIIGLVIGSLILMPMSLFGPVTGTNNAVSSGAHFGIVARLIGSFLAVLTALTFFTLSVFTGGDVIVAVADKVAGVGRPTWLLGLSYLFFSLVVLAICIFGYRLMLLVNNLAVMIATPIVLLSAFGLSGHFDPTLAGVMPDDRAFVPLFLGATLLVSSSPLSFGAFLGDWTRYCPRNTSPRSLMGWTFLAQLATLLPLASGLAVAVAIKTHVPDAAADLNFVGGLMKLLPGWLLAPVVVFALVSGIAAGTSALYGPGLDFSAMFPSLTRIQSTALIGTIATALIFIGLFVTGFVGLVSIFVVLIVVCVTPWAIILTLGLFFRRGWYSADDLQVFNRKQWGGIYWYSGGLNWRAIGAWLPAAFLGLMTVNLPGQFEGPWRNLLPNIGFTTLEGVDLSLPYAMIVSAIFYVSFLVLFPEPRKLFGPKGPRLVPSSDRETPAVRSGGVESPGVTA